MTDGLTPPAPPRLIGLAWLLGAARAQRWMWSESFCKWTRRPLPSVRYARQLGDGQRFALHRGSWMSVLVPIVVVSQFVDVLIAQLAIGFKQRCPLPLTVIADVRRIEHRAGTSGKDWHAAFGLQARDVTLLSPLDPPTLLIALKDDTAGAWWTCNGRTRTLKRWVAVYVDRPDAMRAAVTAAIAVLPSSTAPPP